MEWSGSTSSTIPGSLRSLLLPLLSPAGRGEGVSLGTSSTVGVAPFRLSPPSRQYGGGGGYLVTFATHCIHRQGGERRGGGGRTNTTTTTIIVTISTTITTPQRTMTTITTSTRRRHPHYHHNDNHHYNHHQHCRHDLHHQYHYPPSPTTTTTPPPYKYHLVTTPTPATPWVRCKNPETAGSYPEHLCRAFFSHHHRQLCANARKATNFPLLLIPALASPLVRHCLLN